MPTENKECNSYMDGVPVKISERFKRRPVIRLPTSCQNCTPGPALQEQYNFGMVRNVLTKMEEWKKNRQQQVAALEEKAKRWHDIENEIEKLNKLTIDTSKGTFNSSDLARNNLHHQILQPSNEGHATTTILQPTNASQRPVTTSQIPNNFKISDFETDNSSPFDNMELKTINDMEVLASVLSSNSLPPGPPVVNNTYRPEYSGPVWNSWNGYPTYSSPPQYYTPSHYDSQPMYTTYQTNSHLPQTWPEPAYIPPAFTAAATAAHPTYPHFSPYQYDGTKSVQSTEGNNLQTLKSSSKSVPDLSMELEKEMKVYRSTDASKRKTKTPPPRTTTANIGMEDWQPWPDLESPRHSSENVLAPKVSSLAHNISEMGFPMERVLRSIDKFSGDDKKVIEFLLQVQRLEEKRFKGESAERALHVNNYDEKEAEKHLNAVTILLDYGFDINRVEKALLETKNDRDAALEQLIH